MQEIWIMNFVMGAMVTILVNMHPWLILNIFYTSAHYSIAFPNAGKMKNHDLSQITQTKEA